VRLRLASYNVKSFRLGLGAVRDVLAEESPDVVLVEECGGRRAVERLAGRLGMDAVSGTRRFRSVPNAVLFRPPWRLSGVDVRPLSRDGRTIRRGLVAAHLRSAAGRLTAASVHLGLSDRERVRHAREATDLVAGIEWPVVLGGDLNEGPDGAAVRWVADRLFDAWAGREAGETFPARGPSARIDYLFISAGLAVVEAWVPAGPGAREASDHLPVLADVDLGEAAP
jgi:endonuclease/exonuclease/phosphatase family metal-dependent hydrolase